MFQHGKHGDARKFFICKGQLGRLVEISLNSVTSDMEIRPRDVDARTELDWYASVENPGVADTENAAKVHAIVS